MRPDDRKAAIAAYKEKKIEAGIFAFICVPTGQVWVGSSPNLGQAANRIVFDLGLGKHRNAALQAAWAMHGPGGVAFEARETIDEDTPDYARSSLLKARLESLAAELGASAL